MNPNCLLFHRESERERERENRQSPVVRGWSGGTMVLGKYSEPKRPTNLLIWTIVGQGSIALAVDAGGGCLDIFSLVYLFSFLSHSLRDGPI